MEIHTKRLIIRYLTLNDLEDVFSYASDLEVSRYALWGPNTKEDTHVFLKEVLENYNKKEIKDYDFGIEYEGKIIGGVSLHIGLHNQAEIGWIIHPNYQGQGFATEAAKAILKFARKKDVAHVIAHCDLRNIASFKVMEKLGMTRKSVAYKTRYNKLTKQYDLDELTYQMDI